MRAPASFTAPLTKIDVFHIFSNAFPTVNINFSPPHLANLHAIAVTMIITLKLHSNLCRGACHMGDKPKSQPCKVAIDQAWHEKIAALCSSSWDNSCKGAFVTLTSKNPAGKPTFIPSSLHPGHMFQCRKATVLTWRRARFHHLQEHTKRNIYVDWRSRTTIHSRLLNQVCLFPREQGSMRQENGRMWETLGSCSRKDQIKHRYFGYFHEQTLVSSNTCNRISIT